jgi:hypothetical protein
LSAGTSRPLRLQVAGEKPGEGNPADPGQARMQTSIHEQGGGASVGPQGHVPAYLPSRTAPAPLASRKVAGTPGRLKGAGRREQSVSRFGRRIWATVDTTRSRCLTSCTKKSQEFDSWAGYDFITTLAFSLPIHMLLHLRLPRLFQSGEKAGVPYLAVVRGTSRVFHRKTLIRLQSATLADWVSRLPVWGSCKLSLPDILPPT